MKYKPKIILVDWFNTLSPSKFWGHWEKLDKKEFKKIEKYLFGSPNGLAIDWMTGKFNSESAIEEISKNLKIPYGYLFEEFVISCRQMQFANNNIPLLIKNIRSGGNRVYIFSDNMDSLERWTSPSLKLENLFDSIINSFNVHALKNEVDKEGRNYFLNEVLKITGSHLEDLILFDDNIKTIELFRSFGVKAYHVSKDYPLLDYFSGFNKLL